MADAIWQIAQFVLFNWAKVGLAENVVSESDFRDYKSLRARRKAPLLGKVFVCFFDPIAL